LGVQGEVLSGLDLSGTTHTIAGDYPNDPWTFTDATGNYNNAGSTIHDIIQAVAGGLPPAVQMADDAGNTVIIDSTGAVTFGGSCTVSTCSTSSLSVVPGNISWGGTIGAFHIAAIVGGTKPSLTSPSMNLNLQ